MNYKQTAVLVALFSIGYNFYNCSICIHYLLSPSLPCDDLSPPTATTPSPDPERYCPYNFNKIGGIDDRCFKYLYGKKYFRSAMYACYSQLVNLMLFYCKHFQSGVYLFLKLIQAKS